MNVLLPVPVEPINNIAIGGDLYIVFSIDIVLGFVASYMVSLESNWIS
jgi:hypothetical protein